MSHINKVIDADPHFVIDINTRNIKNVSQTKTSLVQYDHNSERFSFTLPRFIEGHDMMECNSVQVHYFSSANPDTKGLYAIDDLSICEEDAENVCCTWLISRNVTQTAGALQFILRFACLADDGTEEYAWHTNPFRGISISAGMNNTEAVVEQYADILEQWRIELFSLTEEGIRNINTEKEKAVASVESAGQRVLGSLPESVGSLEEIQSMIDAGKKYIILHNNADITLTERLRLPQGTTLIGNGATIRRGAGHRDRLLSLGGNCTVEDLVIDGGSVADGTWDTVIDIATSGNDTISNVTINNGNECIVVYGDNNLVENCKITNAQGNGIHLSGCNKSTIRGNIIKDTNLSEAYTNGRCSIYVCLSVFDCVIDGNYCENGYNGIGNLNTPENQRIKITNNTVVNARNWGMAAQYYSETPEYSPKDCIISHNTIKNSNKVYIGTTHTNIQISDFGFMFGNNILIDTYLEMKGCKNITIADNIFKNGYIKMGTCEKITIVDNRIENPTGVGINGGTASEITVAGNYVTAFNNGITLQGTSAKNHIVNNTINDCDNSTSFYGIQAGEGSIIKGNRLNVGVGRAITCPSNSMAIENIVYAKNSGVTAIILFGGGKNAVVANNMCNENATFAINSSDNVVKENNLVCTGLM